MYLCDPNSSFSLSLSLSLFLFLSHSEILPFSENILCHSLPPLWAFTWPVVYSYFNFKSYSYFIPVLYFRNILSSFPEDLPRGHSEGIHFIPLRFIPSRLGWTILSSRAYVYRCIHIHYFTNIQSIKKKKWVLNTLYFFNCNFFVEECIFNGSYWIIIVSRTMSPFQNITKKFLSAILSLVSLYFVRYKCWIQRE